MPHKSGDNAENVLFNDIPDYDPALALGEEEAARWQELLRVRDVVLKALEDSKDQVKKNQDAEIVLTLDKLLLFEPEELASLFIVSKVTVEQGNADGVAVEVRLSEAPKCPRCWNHDGHIGTDGHHAELCDRCAAVLGD